MRCSLTSWSYFVLTTMTGICTSVSVRGGKARKIRINLTFLSQREELLVSSLLQPYTLAWAQNAVPFIRIVKFLANLHNSGIRTRWHVLCLATPSHFCCVETPPQYSNCPQILLRNLGYRGGQIECSPETCIPDLCLLRQHDRAQCQFPTST